MSATADVDRFWGKVNKTDTCWLWTAGTNGYGYGLFSIGGRAGKDYVAHRVSYEWARGAIPAGLHVDHLCRVRRCVNPDHLEPVTAVVNTRRGMLPRLNPDSVREIRRRAANGEYHRTIAADFGVGKSTVWAVVARITWKDI